MQQKPCSRHRRNIVLAALTFTLSAAACAPPRDTSGPASVPADSDVSPLETQALVMGLADEYIAALGESVYLVTRNEEASPRARWLAQSFLRNGVGAALDIAAGPNPGVGILDLLVSVSLQAWSFERHWMPAGIGEMGRPILARIREAEATIWNTARDALSREQLDTLRALINAWITENPDRTVVALVRFEEFADERKLDSLSLRGKAAGLLREVSEASGAIDEARLLGERILWYAGRYPYVLGEQAELTTYRLADQPEGRELVETLRSVRRLSDELAERAESIRNDLTEQRTALFDRISVERVNAIAQSRQALEDVIQAGIADAAERINAERVAAIEAFFHRLDTERTILLDDLAAREGQLGGLLGELRDTIAASGDLAHELTATVVAIDRVVARFDLDSDSNREPLKMTDVRDAAIEATHAAEQVTEILRLTNELAQSDQLDRRLDALADPLGDVVDRAFWRGAILIALLIGGLALLRYLPAPQRQRQTA
jgi:hypothetical protein